MCKNIMIPMPLFELTIDLLESLDISLFEHPIPCLYDTVLSGFLKKRDKIELRNTYADIIFAENEEQQIDARMKYLYDKRYINEKL